MGAYVSVSDCPARFNVTLDCSKPVANADGTYAIVGGISRGQFQPDPDVAGIGVS